METDSLLITVGLLLMFHGAVMLALYLILEKGTLFDPVSVSWAGYIVFIGLGPLVTGILIPQRGTNEASKYAMFLYILAGIMYTIGLYTGKGGYLSRLIPKPAPFLGAFHVWVMYILCVILCGICFGLMFLLPFQFAKIFGAFIETSMGTLALISILVFIGYKGHFGTKLLMLLTLIVVLMYILKFYFSRRPILAIFITAVAMFYHLKISWRSPAVRKLFIGIVILGGITVTLYLGATRGYRVHEQYGGPKGSIFSRENWENFLGGITINTTVYEFSVQQFPENKGYLHGSGIVPAFVFWLPRAFWPSKPVPTGGVVSRMWFNVSEHKVSVTPTLPGELYVNFGPLGILIGMFFVGKLVRAINTYLVSARDNLVAHMAWFAIIPDFGSEWRGDITSMTVQGFLRVFMFFFLAWLTGKLAHNRQEDISFISESPEFDYAEGYDLYEEF